MQSRYHVIKRPRWHRNRGNSVRFYHDFPGYPLFTASVFLLFFSSSFSSFFLLVPKRTKCVQQGDQGDREVETRLLYIRTIISQLIYSNTYKTRAPSLYQIQKDPSKLSKVIGKEKGKKKMDSHVPIVLDQGTGFVRSAVQVRTSQTTLSPL